jgi:hemolysin activation/secretion protein
VIFSPSFGMAATDKTSSQAVTSSQGTPQQATAAATPAEPVLYIREYRVKGAHLLTPIEVQEAVYPYLGPERTREDVDSARAALEKAYQAKGYQGASVIIPQQQVKRGVILLEVNEGVVAQLRVRSSQYFSQESIRRQARSMQEGQALDFNQVTSDIVGLNQLPDRKVTPALSPGQTPGTLNVDLTVKDSLPLHGSLELNNRYSVNTTQLRLNGSVSYDNLWQLGHSVGFSFQVAPQRLMDAEVFSGYYLVRFPSVSWLSVMVQATKQDSNVSTLGGSAVAGKGETAGLRVIMNLPQGKDFYQSVSMGLDYKHFNQDLTLGGSDIETPVTYYPLSVNYNANWASSGTANGGKAELPWSTGLDASVNFNPRGLGSSLSELDNNRFKASGNYLYLHGDLSHTHDLPGGMQLFGKLSGQVADQPLVNNEQISGGGLGTVRGYLESAVLGDNGVFATMEVRSPSLLWFLKQKEDEWRIYGFLEGGIVTVIDPLPQQDERFRLASFGVGTHMHLTDRLNGTLDVGFPLTSAGSTKIWDPLFTFRVWTEF